MVTFVIILCLLGAAFIGIGLLVFLVMLDDDFKADEPPNRFWLDELRDEK